MADPASGIVGLIFNILQALREVQKAQENMRSTSKTLKTVAYRLDCTSKSLMLIKDERNLQTPSVEQQLVTIVYIAEELRSFFNRLEAMQRHKAMRRFAHALAVGDREEAELTNILSRLESSRNELVLRISVAQVGLMGNLNEGFKVSANVLMDTNRKCKMILGRELALAHQLKGKRAQRDGNIHLDQREVQKLRLADPANVKNVVPHTRIRMNDNVTLGKARIAAGDMGCSPWERSIPKSMDVSRNWFGNDLRMLAGDVGSGAAPGFNSMFWK